MFINKYCEHCPKAKIVSNYVTELLNIFHIKYYFINLPGVKYFERVMKTIIFRPAHPACLISRRLMKYD